MKTKKRVRVFLLLIACLLMLALCSCTKVEYEGECLDVVSLLIWGLVLLVSIVVVAGMIKMELRE